MGCDRLDASAALGKDGWQKANPPQKPKQRSKGGPFEMRCTYKKSVTDKTCKGEVCTDHERWVAKKGQGWAGYLTADEALEDKLVCCFLEELFDF